METNEVTPQPDNTAELIKGLSNAEFAEEFGWLRDEVEADPMKNFIEHPLFMNFQPTPAQRVALKTIFCQELDETGTAFNVWMETQDPEGKFDLEMVSMTELELYKFMTDRDYDVTQVKIRNKINFIIGRRGGKTTLSAMLAIYCAIITNWKPYLQKTPFATVLILSHSKEFSDEVLEIIRTFIEASPVLKRLINLKKKNTASTMNLSVPFIEKGKIVYSRVQIKVGAASSKTTRGIAACAVLCDEIAFWNLDENMKETDEKIMRAVRPAMKQFGKRALLIKLSSPGIKQGVLYSEYLKWQKGTLPKSYAVFKAPSWVWNTILPKDEFIEEWELDQDGFDTEYRANFVESLSNYIQPEFIDMAIVKGRVFAAPEPKNSQVVYRAAIDAAFKKDHFTFSVVGHFENRIKQYVLKGWEGSKKKPIKAKEVAEFVSQIVKQFGIDEVEADQFSFEPLREIFSQFGVTLKERPFTLTFKKQIYSNLKRLIHSQQIDLLDHERLPKELKELVVEVTGSGQIRIGHPPGGSDDYSDSTAISAFSAVESAGQMGYSFETTLSREDYGVKVDQHGRTFSAPPPEMLAESYGYPINDNSSMYVKDPETGKLKRREDDEEEEDDDDDVGPQFII